ncbi:MAG TPA: M6 family metalloprotease domain-containing protein [Tenuifilaceae bacterium]|nr:M6 family metalloprotease domain-containing protein [Tenuifilaceae bacterium]
MKAKAKILINCVIVFSLALLLNINSYAAYLKNVPTVVKNPDGTEIRCFATGDEYFNYLHDADGYTIIQGKDGYYYYAHLENGKVAPSKYRVNSVNPTKVGLKPNVLISPEEYQKRTTAYWKDVDDPTGKAPHQGTINNLVVYIRFNDDSEFTSPRTHYDQLFNPAEGISLKNYYQEVSYGQLNIESHHYPYIEDFSTNLSYQDSHPRGYYQPYNATTNTIGYQDDDQSRVREHTLLVNAINAISDQVPTDLAIDGDNDGRVDNVCFIIRGNSEGWADLLWAHRWVLYSYVVNINGKRVYDYTFQPENQAVVSTICHEMFHALGAPDLYRYTGSGFDPVGPWDLMANGFVHMGAHMKRKYSKNKWVSQIPTISEPGEYTLNPITSSENNAYRINSPNSSSQYFVLEYRRKTGLYEGNIPGSGLIVYRINTTAGDGNASGPPDEVYVYRPNGTTTVNGNINQAFFSAGSGRTSITDNTNPSSFLANGDPGGLNIINITEAGETISFTISEKVGYVLKLKAQPWSAGTCDDLTNTPPYTEGTEVTIKATPIEGYGFVKWTIGDQELGKDNPMVFTMPDHNVEITGHFEWGAGVNDNSQDNIRIYPNPMAGTLNIDNLNDAKSIAITNLIGVELINRPISNGSTQVSIDTEGLRAGIYIVTIKLNDGTKYVKRLIKQ